MVVEKNFDTLHRKCKRDFQTKRQSELNEKLLSKTYARDFWKGIGKIGIAETRIQRIPMEVKDENGVIINDRSKVMDCWKHDYESLYSADVDSRNIIRISRQSYRIYKTCRML